MSRILLFICCLLLTAFAYSQEVNVSFKITNPKGEPLPFATVSVMPVADTMAKQTKTADSIGAVNFHLLPNNLYTVRISSVNYQELEKTINVKQGATSFRFVVQPLSKSLNSVVVTARKPLMRQEDDKTIVDPEPIANASTNAY